MMIARQERTLRLFVATHKPSLFVAWCIVGVALQFLVR